MTIMTPNAKGHERLSSLASRYIDVASLPWVPTRFKGVDLKVLMEDKETGLMTALTRFAPGATLPDHEHTELRAGGLACRRRGCRHRRQLRLASGRQPPRRALARRRHRPFLLPEAQQVL